MKISYDPDKNAKNIRERGLSFDDVAFLDWPGATIDIDVRKNYGEIRYRAFGRIGDRLYVVIYTLRGNVTWVISFRKANSREEALYEKNRKT